MGQRSKDNGINRLWIHPQFMDPQVAKATSTKIEELIRPMKIRVANGQYGRATQTCKAFKWQMHKLEFNFELRLFKVGGCDIVLGMVWIDSVTPIVIHSRPSIISFRYGTEVVTLFGVTYSENVTNVNVKVISKLLRKCQCNFMAQLSLIGPIEKAEEIPREIIGPI